MSINKNYAVFGLGRYGSAVAAELIENGADVIAVDMNPKKVEEKVKDFPFCKCADITDKETLLQLGIDDTYTVIIAMSGELEASVIATMLCKEAGVENVIVKCACETHRRIFEKVGADTVILPESESGKRLAKNLLCRGFIDIADISDSVSVIETNVISEWDGKTLTELDLRKKYGINVIAVRSGEETQMVVNPGLVLSSEMKLVVVADKKVIAKMLKRK